MVLAAFDSAGGLIPSTAPAGDASLTPLQPITSTVNTEIEGGSGVVSSTATTQPTTDVPSMLGASGVTASASAYAGEAASSVALNTPFPFQQPVVNCRFSNHDESHYDKGYDSEGSQMYYDNAALDEDKDDFSEVVIGNNPSPAAAAPVAPAPVEPTIFTLEMVASLKVVWLKE